MTICTENGGASVNVGTSVVWNSFKSMVLENVENYEVKYPKAFMFFDTFKCDSTDAAETALQVKKIHEKLGEKQIGSTSADGQKTSYDLLFTTADGENLIAAIMELLNYSALNNTNVIPCF